MSENLEKNQKHPIISVVIPFYNREEYLAEAIESVISQHVKDWEIILINDGSTDKSLEIAQTYIKKHPEKIKLFAHHNNKNLGASASRNVGIKNANGKFITFLDSDDVFFKDSFERELKAFKDNPNADAVCGTLECWYSWSADAAAWEKDFIIDLVIETEKLYQSPDLLVHNLDAGGRKPGINCVMLKSSFVKQVGLFEEEFKRTAEDQVFWAKVSLKGQIYVMDAVLAKYRQHPASTCAVETRYGDDIPLMIVFLEWLESFLTKEKITDEKIWKALKQFQRNLYIENKFRPLKQMYRRMFPLHMRYSMRDNWTKFKKKLLRSSHR